MQGYPPIRTGAPGSGGGFDYGPRQTPPSGGGAAVYPEPEYHPESPAHAAAAQLYESPKAGTQAQHRRQPGTSSGGGSRLSAGGATGGGRVSGAGLYAVTEGGVGVLKQKVVYGNRRPLRSDASWFATLVALFYLGSLVYYLYVRLRFTLGGKDDWYSILILVVELLGVSSVVPYALLNVVHTHPTGSPGLPVDDGMTDPDKKFHVRVLVPCYKEPLSVVAATIDAALAAHLPAGCTRTLYLCDDGADHEKRAWLEETHGSGGAVVYVSGRERVKGEINGKSANLNNALKNVIYKDTHARPDAIPKEEVVVVFDADMQAKPLFYCKILEVMADDDVALCLTPQAFSNVDPEHDIFNNTNQQFWEYILPGADFWGYIACTGTNFCIRSRALSTVGWFPTYSITEDYALSMELKAAGFKGRYMAEYLAVGEAPEELRNVLRQRSRWCKGHMQIFFSLRNPLLRWRLPLVAKWLYNNGTWSYFTNILATWTFLLVPFVSLMFDLNPVKFSRQFALAAALYLSANFLVQSYFHVAAHLRGVYFAQVSNYLLTFTYFKAIINTLLSKVHLKKKAGFKPTDKTSGGGAPGTALQTAFMSRLTSLTRRFNQATLPQLYQPQMPVSSAPQKKEDDCIPEKLFMAACLSVCVNTLVLGLRQVFVLNTVTAWLALPCLWAIYNAVPPVLFFTFVLGSSKTLGIAAFWLQLVSTLSGLGAVVSLFFIAPPV